MSSRSDKNRSSSSNESTGVSTRLIENWLTKTTERGFEVPFAQLLSSDGHTIVHIDSHSPQEQGKDIITLDSQGKPCGFQLKQQDISGHRWDREIFPELNQLIELPAWHPRVKDKFVKPYLVTTGTLNNTAQLRLSQFNAGLRERKFTPVVVMDRHELTKRFADAFGRFLPLKLENTKQLLQFYLGNGDENLKRANFYELLSNFPSFRKGERGKIRRYLSGLPILCAYAVAPAAAYGNHLAQAEAWILVATRILKIAETHSLKDEDWRSSYILCRDATVALLDSLANEALSSDDLVSGNHLGDGGIIWRARVTMLMGCLAASRLAAHLQGQDDRTRDSEVVDFILEHSKDLLVWGESAASYTWEIYWFMRRQPKYTIWAENFLAKYAYIVSISNGGSRGQGIAPPHHSVDKCLSRHYSSELEDELRFTTFSGNAYTVRPVVFELARALRRQLLVGMWPTLSEISYAHLDHKDTLGFYDFQASAGTEVTAFFDRPTHWAELRGQAAMDRDRLAMSLPELLLQDPVFAVLFPLVYPHRLDIHFTSAISDLVR